MYSSKNASHFVLVQHHISYHNFFVHTFMVHELGFDDVKGLLRVF